MKLIDINHNYKFKSVITPIERYNYYLEQSIGNTCDKYLMKNLWDVIITPKIDLATLGQKIFNNETT